LGEYLRRALVLELLDGHLQPAGDTAREVGGDVPVRPALPDGRDGAAHALHAPFAVREGPVLFRERSGRQDDVREFGRLVGEYVLDHQELQLLDRLFRVGDVGLAQERVFAGDVHAVEAALRGELEHLRGAQALLGGQRRAPGGLELRPVGVAEALITGQVVGYAAGVAAPLHVVLAPQGRDAVTRTAQLAGDEGKVEEGVGVVR